MKEKTKNNGSVVAKNKRAAFDYFLSDNLEVGLQLEGWEASSARQSGAVRIVESYVFIRDGELFISGMSITPKKEADKATKMNWGKMPEPTRVRKLLAHRREIDKLRVMTEREGYTLLATKAYWSGSNLKLEIALGKGKKNHDKRQTEKDRDWSRKQSSLLKSR